jgi:homoserine O-acetyltransferase
MLHQGTKFAKRFDANAYIRIINMWTAFDLETITGRSVDETFRRYAEHNIPFILFSINTDCCFTSRDISHFHRRLLKNGVQAEYQCIHSQKGHDSFLLEPELYQAGITAYLEKI